MFDALRRDIRTVFERDPALRSRLEALLCYPGVHALAFHRVAHRLWGAGWVCLMQRHEKDWRAVHCSSTWIS